MGGLLFFHIFLATHNTTTYEYIKKTWKTNQGNPFHKGKLLNFLNVLCTSTPHSHFNPREFIPQIKEGDGISRNYHNEALVSFNSRYKNTSVENDRGNNQVHRRGKSGAISPSEIGSLRFDV